MSNLIIFDIDGTLINYITCEDSAYLQAVSIATGLNDIDTNWDTYRYSTDSGVFSEIILRAFNRKPECNEITSVKNNFISYLSNYFKINSHSCRCIPGAKTIFGAIKNINWDIAIATGGWKESAIMKLEVAGILRNEIPIAHSDDHYDRKDIIMTAIDRAQKIYKKNSYQNIIYVGDAWWDLEASLALKIKFIGIGNNFNSINDKNFFCLDNYENNKLIHYLHRT